jgi:hypothetical protein
VVILSLAVTDLISVPVAFRFNSCKQSAKTERVTGKVGVCGDRLPQEGLLRMKYLANNNLILVLSAVLYGMGISYHDRSFAAL